MEQSLAQTYKDNMTLVTRSLEQYKNEMAIFQKKYDMLRDDYQYNLEVIKERDEELKKYDTYVANLREVAAFSRGSRRREWTRWSETRKHMRSKFKRSIKYNLKKNTTV